MTASPPEPSFEDHAVTYTIDMRIYPLPALFRTCYWFTNTCFIYLSPGPTSDIVKLRIAPKDRTLGQEAVAGEFLNSLLDHTLRYQIAQETATLRTLIYTQAFAEAEPSESK